MLRIAARVPAAAWLASLDEASCEELETSCDEDSDSELVDSLMLDADSDSLACDWLEDATDEDSDSELVDSLMLDA